MINKKNSVAKRIRQTASRRLHNRYYGRTTRSRVKLLRAMEDYEEASKALPKVASMLDHLTKRGVIHKNKASNLKSKLAKHVNSLRVQA
ncbi:ribosomal protein S20 [Bacteroidales bacterium KA00251]|nr:ribosomal protein S20 [Bacteroidales bacterium KA00251]